MVVFYVSMRHGAGMQGVEEFRGLWTRSLIAWPDGRRDVSTQVRWLQGAALFADLRQPAGLEERISGATCRDALTAEDCLALSAQQGFCGRFEDRGGAYEWVRRIDLQPRQAVRDIGRLFWRDGVLVEEGLETAYTEHWHRDEVPRKTACAGLLLREAGRDVFGCLLLVEDRFAYGRGRGVAIAGSSLTPLVAGAASLAEMQRLVDCEISFGDVPQGWRIGRSSLPYRVGLGLSARLKAGRLVMPDADAAGRPVERVWEILEQEGDSSMILDTIPKNF